MTLFATRDGQNIKIHGNVGIDASIENSHFQEVTVTENAQHAEYFHKQLGDLLAEAKAEREDNA